MELPTSNMTTAEKLSAMEQLWTSLENQSDHEPPEWHKKVLAERQRKIDSGEATFSKLEEIQDRIKKERS